MSLFILENSERTGTASNAIQTDISAAKHAITAQLSDMFVRSCTLLRIFSASGIKQDTVNSLGTFKRFETMYTVPNTRPNFRSVNAAAFEVEVTSAEAILRHCHNIPAE